MATYKTFESLVLTQQRKERLYLSSPVKYRSLCECFMIFSQKFIINHRQHTLYTGEPVRNASYDIDLKLSWNWIFSGLVRASWVVVRYVPQFCVAKLVHIVFCNSVLEKLL